MTKKKKPFKFNLSKFNIFLTKRFFLKKKENQLQKTPLIKGFEEVV
jgi:hypothetical protein